jgi:hypothetical protein
MQANGEVAMKRNTRAEDGQTLIYVALGMVVLLGFVALAIDGGHLYAERRAMQNAADAGALAGARELCLGLPADTAEAVAREYAVTQNGAAWATPTASGYDMFVDAGETSNLFFGGIGGIIPGSMTVAASAQARCVRPGTGCTTWPLTLKQSQFNSLGCGDTVYITVEQEKKDCPSGCDCSHIFSGVSDPQRGWFVRPNESCGSPGGANGLRGALYYGGYADWQIHEGDCIRGKTGADVGTFTGGSHWEDWLDANGGHPTVRLPLFSSFGAGGCGAGEKDCKSYTVGGFGCLDVTAFDQKKLDPKLFGPTCSMDISKVVIASVHCPCTLNCGSAGGPPNANEALVPVLVQ